MVDVSFVLSKGVAKNCGCVDVMHDFPRYVPGFFGLPVWDLGISMCDGEDGAEDNYRI